MVRALLIVMFTAGVAHAGKAKPAPKAAAPKAVAKAQPAPAKPIEKKAPAAKTDAAGKPADAPKPEATRELVQRESKIEFDDRLVQGQRAQGAVYLFQRGELKFSTLVKKPTTFKDRTLTSVYGAEEKSE